MDKNNLLTIKEFSALTGVRPHMLRHYDSLGVLPPAYVDPNSGYRYYAFHQRELVYAIQMCIDVGIPLKQFEHYLADDQSVLRCGKLGDDISCYLKKQLQKLQAVERWNRLRCDMLRLSDIIRASDEPVRITYPSLNCILIPFHEKRHKKPSQTWAEALAGVISPMKHEPIIASGLLLKYEDGAWKQFLVGVLLGDPSEWIEDSRFCRLPAGEYLCKKVSHSGLEQAWEWSAPYADREEIELILETELIMSDYNYVSPYLAQRCLLKQKQTP